MPGLWNKLQMFEIILSTSQFAIFGLTTYTYESLLQEQDIQIATELALFKKKKPVENEMTSTFWQRIPVGTALPKENTSGYVRQTKNFHASCSVMQPVE